MSFFDNFTKTVTATSQGAIQKTKELAEIAKVNGQITEERGKLYRTYQRLGEYCYQNKRAAKNQEYQPFFDQIAAVFQEIDLLEKELQDLKGLMTCPFCGRSIPKNTVFCSLCGQKVVTKDVCLCRGCGAVAPAGTSFCTKCGTKMDIITSDFVQTEKKLEVCAHCGAVLETGAMFCASCGAEVVQSRSAILTEASADFIADTE